MTFYNPMPPFFPPLFPNKFSYNPNRSHQNNVNNSSTKYDDKKISNFPENSKNNTIFFNDASKSSKGKKKVFMNNYLLDNIFSEIHESDTLILLGLIYLLYIQENNDLIIYILFLILINI